MKTATTTESLTTLLNSGLITYDEHATLVRMTEDDYVASLSMEGGDAGLFFPANETETAFARYWTDEQYSWDDMLADIEDFGEAGAITSSDMDKYWDAAVALGDEDHAREVIRKKLSEADPHENQGTKQAACDAVEFVSLSGTALDAARDIDNDDEDELAALVEFTDEDSSTSFAE